MKLLLSTLFALLVVQLLAQDLPKSDTIEIGGVTIIRDHADAIPPPEPKKSFLKKLGSSTNPKSVKTQWMIVDLGMSNYTDNTDYASLEAQGYAPGSNEEWTSLKPFKSHNVNIWIATRQFNLIRHYVNFQYGLGVELNNYYYKQPIRYQAQTQAIENAPVLHLDLTPGRKYSKNKLAADYVTVPIMLNFNLTPYKLYAFEISAGVSAGYLYSARNKYINSDEGKHKTRGDFDLRPWKLSYIAEVNLGIIRLYGSYAFKSMYQRGFDITPYNVGIRIKPVEIFGKIEFN